MRRILAALVVAVVMALVGAPVMAHEMVAVYLVRDNGD